MRTNQAGEPIEEEMLYAHGMTFGAIDDKDRDAAIALLCQHFGVEIVRTNATKHGTTDVVLREVE